MAAGRDSRSHSFFSVSEASVQLTRRQLERQREGVEAQMRWAVLHGGDQELLDLLAFEIDRLFVKIGELPRSPIGQAREAMLTAATQDSSLEAER
jgi:hypothetical protein